MEILTAQLKEGVWIAAAIVEIGSSPLLVEATVGENEQMAIGNLAVGSETRTMIANDEANDNKEIMILCSNLLFDKEALVL